MAQTIVSSPFTDNRMTLTVSHTSHGFVSGDIGKAVRSSGTDGQFVVARANTAANAEVVGIITSIDTTNQYTITTSGFVDVVAAVPTATAGTVYFLAEAADSQLTATEPTTVGAVSKPVAVITESNAKMILIHYRGEVLTSTTQTNAPNDAQYVTLAVNSDLSAERVLTAGSGISLTDAGANGAITIANTQSAGPSQASTVEITTPSDVDKYVPPDLMKHHHGVAKAWAALTSAGSVEDSHGVSGVSNPSTGTRVISWSTNFGDGDYAIGASNDGAGTADVQVMYYHEGGRQTTQVTSLSYTGTTLANHPQSFVVFGKY